MQVLNEIVMTEKNLINFVLKDVSAQSAAKIAKSSFYSLLHAKAPRPARHFKKLDGSQKY